MATQVESWSGAGKVFKVGNLARLASNKRATYKITGITVLDDGAGVEITAYGGTPGRMMTRCFKPEELVKLIGKKVTSEGNAPWRSAVSEVSTKSKQRKKGARR